jgi:hypothetical protein
MEKAVMLKSSPLIIVSMHRSGSSLVASLLQSAGLQIGERLMASARDNNVKGFFENLDFVEFHRDLLGSQGLNQDGWTREKKIKVDDLFIDRAKQLIAQNSTDTYWGWKDPRTTLFLKFWAELLPEAKFVMIFRSPWEVVDSLYRRGDPFFQAEPELAVKMWLHYNKKILKFINSSSHRCLLANIKTISDDPGFWIEAINQKFQTHLNVPNLDICEPSLLQSQSINSRRSTLIDQYFPKATILYKALNAQAWYPNHKAFAEQQSDLVSNERSAFTDWRDLRILEMHNRNLEAQVQRTEVILKQSQAQVHEIHTAFERSQTQLHETEAVLEQSQAQLHETEAVLEQSQAQLCETETVLERSQALLQKTREELFQNQKLKATLEERSQLQLHLASDPTRVGNMQYELLVWDAWNFYHEEKLIEMREHLELSLRYSPFQRSENPIKWLERFSELSLEKEIPLDIIVLTNTSEWKQLMRTVMTPKRVYNINSSKLVTKVQV